MSIWRYSAHDDDVHRVRSDIESRRCIYCGTDLTVRSDDHHVTFQNRPGASRFVTEQRRLAKSCRTCGWWLIKATSHMANGSLPIMDYDYRTLGASGVLRRFDTAAQTEPVSEIRQYLAARYDARFHIDPRRFEDVVVSVYRDLGYDVEATGKTGDGGVDAVLRRNGSAVGVQVKRVHGKVEAEAIRSFAGALYLKGMLRGVFVTTSDFTRGARKTAELASDRVPIYLVDARTFYNQLGLAQRRSGSLQSDAPEFPASAELHVLTSSRSWP
jgi:hypothetical protein